MTTNELIEKLNSKEIHNVSLSAIFFNENIGINKRSIMNSEEKRYFNNRESLSGHYINTVTVGEIKTYLLSYFVDETDENNKLWYYHPRHLFRFENEIVHHVKIPVPLDYRTVSSIYPKYQTQELINRDIIKKICSNSGVVSFLANRVEEDKNTKAVHESEQIYVCGEGFYIYFSPSLLLETDFALTYGKPEIKIKMIGLNKYGLTISASKRTSYLRDTDSDIEAIFNLNTFSFEKFEISQSNYNLK